MAILLAVAGIAGVLSLAATIVRLTSPGTGTLIPPDGYRATGVAVDVPPGYVGPFRDDDLVITLAGVPMTEWAARAFALEQSGRRNNAGEPFAAQVIRGGETVDVQFELLPAPDLASVGAWGTLTFVVVLLAVAGFVFWRRPTSPAAGALLIASVGAAGSTFPYLLGQDPLSLAIGSFALPWFPTVGVYLLLWGGLMDFMTVFPRPLPFVEARPWLRIAPYALVYGAYLGALGVASLDGPSPVRFLGLTGELTLVPTVIAFVVLPVLALIRWRTGPREDRRLIRGFAYVMVLIIGLDFVIWVGPELIGHEPIVPTSMSGLTGLPFPIVIAASILRYRAFDFDVVVRRSLVYGGLTIAILLVYTVTAVALGAVLGGSTLFATSLLATGIAAVAALPLRDTLQRASTRLVYGDRDEPVRAIRRLGDRLELSAEPGALARVVVDTVADALRLPYVALELGTPPNVRLAAERGAPQPDVTQQLLVFHGKRVGRLLVARGPGDPLEPSDQRLLEDLARQVGVAAHAALLTEDLRASRERLVTAREEERRRLRRDLHDGLGPALAAIGMRAEVAQTMVAADPAQAARVLGELQGEVAAAVGDVRRLVDGLRPPALDELGLVGALRLAAGRLESERGPAVTIEADADLAVLPAAVEVAAYRIVTEALTNAVRHADATRCAVRVTGGDELQIVVEDDGRGLPDERRDGVGIGSMQERAAELGGECRVEPTVGGGTRVVARLPIAGMTGAAS